MPSLLSCLPPTSCNGNTNKDMKRELVREESTVAIHESLVDCGLEDITIDVPDDSKHVAQYCIPLITAQFCGQTCCSDKKVQFSIYSLGTLSLSIYSHDSILCM